MAAVQSKMAEQLASVALAVRKIELDTSYGFSTIKKIGGAFATLRQTYMDSAEDEDFPKRAVKLAKKFSTTHSSCANAIDCLSPTNFRQVLIFCNYNKPCGAQLGTEMIVTRLQLQFIDMAASLWSGQITHYDREHAKRFHEDMNQYVDAWQSYGLPPNACASKHPHLAECQEEGQATRQPGQAAQCEIAHRVTDLPWMPDPDSRVPALAWLRACCCGMRCSPHPFVGDSREFVCGCPAEGYDASKDYGKPCFKDVLSQLSAAPQGQGLIMQAGTQNCLTTSTHLGYQRLYLSDCSGDFGEWYWNIGTTKALSWNNHASFCIATSMVGSTCGPLSFDSETGHLTISDSDGSSYIPNIYCGGVQHGSLGVYHLYGVCPYLSWNGDLGRPSLVVWLVVSAGSTHARRCRVGRCHQGRSLASPQGLRAFQSIRASSGLRLWRLMVL